MQKNSSGAKRRYSPQTAPLAEALGKRGACEAKNRFLPIAALFGPGAQRHEGGGEQWD
jgi:hypothetical protein